MIAHDHFFFLFFFIAVCFQTETFYNENLSAHFIRIRTIGNGNCGIEAICRIIFNVPAHRRVPAEDIRRFRRNLADFVLTRWADHESAFEWVRAAHLSYICLIA